MSRQYENHTIDITDLKKVRVGSGDKLLACPDPNCDGVFKNHRVLEQHAECICIEFDCTHCHKKLYLAHERPTSVILQVPKGENEQASPAFA